MQIGFKWLSGPFEDTFEMFDAHAFTEECSGKVFEHETLDHRRRSQGKAICLLTVAGNKARLNYEAFFEMNKARDMYYGVMELELEKTPRLRIARASWKDRDSTSFNHYDIQPTNRRSASRTLEALREREALQVMAAYKLRSEERLALLENAPKLPQRLAVTTYVYDRNPVVVAEALARANGICQECGNKAPFISESTGLPYLEVHHEKPLSKGGEDILENVLALCPNCHRKAHYGADSKRGGKLVQT